MELLMGSDGSMQKVRSDVLMLHQQGQIYIVAYRLEDEQGQSRDYIDGRLVIIPDGYYLAYMNPTIYREREYQFIWPKCKMYQYLLYPTALTYDSGEVLFRKDDVISKSKLGV